MEGLGFEGTVGLEFVSEFCFDFVEEGLIVRVDDAVRSAAAAEIDVFFNT